MQSIGVVGSGRLGSALARALVSAGYRVTALASGTGASASTVAQQLAAGVVAVPVEQVAGYAKHIFLAVPDASIANVCAMLAVTPGHAVIHTSGAQGLAALAPAHAMGAQVGVFHPLQAFTASAPSDVFAGISIGIEADGQLGDELQRCAERLGARALSLRGVDRACYHAAAVFASNYLVALQLAAARAWELAGLPRDLAQAALAPLTVGAARNLLHAPLAQALTGPLVRGDVATVEQHLQALGADPPLVQLYRALGAQLLGLPLPLEPEVRSRLQAMLAPLGKPQGDCI